MEANTKDITQGKKLNITPGEWKIIERGENDAEREKSTLPYGIYAESLHYVAVEPIVDVYAFPPNEPQHLERYKDNCTAICNAVNETYGKGIDPLSLPELIKENEELKTKFGEKSVLLVACDNLLRQREKERDELQATNVLLVDAVNYYKEGIDHFYKCINFGQSALDAKAIEFMNLSNLKFEKVLAKLKKESHV